MAMGSGQAKSRWDSAFLPSSPAQTVPACPSDSRVMGGWESGVRNNDIIDYLDLLCGRTSPTHLFLTQIPSSEPELIGPKVRVTHNIQLNSVREINAIRPGISEGCVWDLPGGRSGGWGWGLSCPKMLSL